MKNTTDKNPEQMLSRKEAIKKAGKYAAFTAAAAITLLAPKEAQAQSTPTGLGDGYRNPTYSPPGGRSNNSPFSKPEPSESKSGLRDSPWK